MAQYLTGEIGRYCRIRTTLSDDDEDPFSTDQDGFLLVPHSPNLVARPGAIVTPAMAADEGSLVLLGEPGVGKTTVFERLANQFAREGSEVVWVNAITLVDATFDYEIGRFLQSSPEASHSSSLTIVLDQIDESEMLERLPYRLRMVTRTPPLRPLRMLVACRTAEYPVGLTAALKALSGGCVVADLAPLTRAQATALVVDHGFEPEALIAAAIEVGAGPLASVPLTLELLGRVYETDGALPLRPADVFTRGVERLAEEPFDAMADAASSSIQRLAVAGRAAARMTLSAHRTLWTGIALDAASGDLNVASLTGGREQLPGGGFDVTTTHVRETVRTALFTGRGDYRLAFRHSSIAAFLAARHLLDHEVPRAQLRQIFLASAETGDAAIPWPLRETAAWLVALDPPHCSWLAEADPESLAPHSAVVDSDSLRALIVSGLLERAPALELSRRAWRRARWSLRHPGLAAQLTAVFHSTGGSETQQWESMARVRLAVRLAEDARDPALTSSLLDIAEGDAWSPHIRRSAASAAFACAATVSAPRLTSLLARFADISWAVTIDPDDELRGGLLELLWPEHIGVTTVLPHLRPRRSRNFIGSYAMFLRDFAMSISGSDVSEVLEWATRRASTSTTLDSQSASASAPEQTSDSDDPEDEPIGRLDATLVDLLIDAALSERSSEGLIPGAVFLAWQRLRRYHTMEMPRALDDGDPDAIADAVQRDHIRREFAAQLATTAVESVGRTDVWAVIHGWQARSDFSPVGTNESVRRRSRLLDGRDFLWLLDQCDVAEGSRLTACGQLAADVFDRDDIAAVNLASERVGRPSWEYLKPFFDPVDLSSELADMLRRASRPRPERTWEESPRWHTQLADLLRRLAEGEIDDVFWRLVHVLQVDPAKGTQYDPEHKDDLFAFPGAAALSVDDRGLIEFSMLPYLLRQNDYADEWIGSGTWDRRALAGYIALCHLERLGRLTEIPDHAWASWTGSVIWFHPMNDDEAHRRRRRLLGAFLDRVPRLVSERLVQFGRGELSRGRYLWTLHGTALPPAVELSLAAQSLCVEIVEAMATLPVEVDADDTDPGVPVGQVPSAVTLPRTAQGVSAALDAWDQLTKYIYSVDPTAFDKLLTFALGGISTESAAKTLAAEAAATALRADVYRNWPGLRVILADPVVGKPVIWRLGNASLEGFDISGDLDVVLIAELYRWARRMLPPDEDRNLIETHWVDQEEAARRWRDALVRVLANSGAVEAIRVLSQLVEEHPEHLAVRAALVAAVDTARLRSWQPPEVSQLANLLVDGARRLVRSDHELAFVVLEALDDIGQEISRHGELLWNYVAGQEVLKTGVVDREPWDPKFEGAVQAYFAHELTHRLARRAVVVNREVFVKPTTPTGAGTRSDILIEAIDHSMGEHPTRSAVVVEIKGNWNSELATGQRTQLANEYLPTLDSRAGIYLVAWFPIRLWTVNSSRRRSVARRAPDEILAELTNQAGGIEQESGVEITPVIIEIPRPFRL